MLNLSPSYLAYINGAIQHNTNTLYLTPKRSSQHHHTEEITRYEIFRIITWNVKSTVWQSGVLIVLSIWPINTLVAGFMGPTRDPSVADKTQMGPMLALWTLVSGKYWFSRYICQIWNRLNWIWHIFLDYKSSRNFNFDMLNHFRTVCLQGGDKYPPKHIYTYHISLKPLDCHWWNRTIFPDYIIQCWRCMHWWVKVCRLLSLVSKVQIPYLYRMYLLTHHKASTMV